MHDTKQNRWRARNPWFNHWQKARIRCQNPKHTFYHRYGGRGIEFHLTLNEARYLWERDGAWQLKQPSLDRVNPAGHYNLCNCQFIELRANKLKMLHGKVNQ